jgi:hypothetical protein
VPEDGDNGLAVLHVAHDAVSTTAWTAEHVLQENSLEQGGPIDADALRAHRQPIEGDRRPCRIARVRDVESRDPIEWERAIAACG